MWTSHRFAFSTVVIRACNWRWNRFSLSKPCPTTKWTDACLPWVTTDTSGSARFSSVYARTLQCPSLDVRGIVGRRLAGLRLCLRSIDIGSNQSGDGVDSTECLLRWRAWMATWHWTAFTIQSGRKGKRLLMVWTRLIDLPGIVRWYHGQGSVHPDWRTNGIWIGCCSPIGNGSN